jgi:hypothetical protein
LPSYRSDQATDREDEEMKTVKMSLCPACTACPEVEIVGDEIRIGETGNVAVLKKDEWNILVELVLSGQLSEV